MLSIRFVYIATCIEMSCLFQSMEHGVPGPTGLCVAVHVDQDYIRDSAPVLIPDELLMGRIAMVSQLKYVCVK